MARNEEKARAMLNVYLRRHEIGRIQEKRPTFTGVVKTTEECEKWLRQITSEVVHEVGLIQNTTLDETQIREKNDLINKLLKERRFWELRIIELSGFDYAESIGIDCKQERWKHQQKRREQQLENQAIITGDVTNYKKRQRFQQRREEKNQQKGLHDQKGQWNTNTKKLGINGDFDSNDVIAVDGYYYFGAAKHLPGVRELYERSKVKDVLKVKKIDLKLRADAKYFGFLEDYDHPMLREELEMENEMLQQMIMYEPIRLQLNTEMFNLSKLLVQLHTASNTINITENKTKDDLNHLNIDELKQIAKEKIILSLLPQLQQQYDTIQSILTQLPENELDDDKYIKFNSDFEELEGLLQPEVTDDELYKVHTNITTNSDTTINTTQTTQMGDDNR